MHDHSECSCTMVPKCGHKHIVTTKKLAHIKLELAKRTTDSVVDEDDGPEVAEI